MNNRIKQVVLEMLRMGEDPEIIKRMVADVYNNITDAIDFKDQKGDYVEYYLAIKEADFRP